MNERIKLLAEQANLWRILNSYSWEFGNCDAEKDCGEELEKFAELIVRECMKLNSKELSITAIERLLPLYREHFGIEE